MECCVDHEILMPGDDMSNEPEIISSEGLCDFNNSITNDFVLVLKFDH